MVEKAPEKSIVPFRPENVDKKPVPHNITLPVGPLPYEQLIKALDEVEEQGWTSKHLAFSGMVPVKIPVIMRAQQDAEQLVPVFRAAICKVFCEGEEFNPPYYTVPNKG